MLSSCSSQICLGTSAWLYYIADHTFLQLCTYLLLPLGGPGKNCNFYSSGWPSDVEDCIKLTAPSWQLGLRQAQLLFLFTCLIVCYFLLHQSPPSSLGQHCEVLSVHLFILCFRKMRVVFLCPSVFKLCKLMLCISLFLTFIFEYIYPVPCALSKLCPAAASTLWCVITCPLSTSEVFCIFIPNAYTIDYSCLFSERMNEWLSECVNEWGCEFPWYLVGGRGSKKQRELGVQSVFGEICRWQLCDLCARRDWWEGRGRRSPALWGVSMKDRYSGDVWRYLMWIYN